MCLYSYVAVSADHQVILAQLLRFWFLRQMSITDGNFLKKNDL